MRKGFTLLEMMAAVLLGALVMLMIAGCLRSSIRAWEAVQERVAVNYNRRNVLELVKRQTSSLFFKEDVDEIEQLGTVSRLRNQRLRNNRTAGSDRNDPNAVTSLEDTGPAKFELPEGAYFFKGELQELNFLSTISFLSDFPGQVAVRYYVAEEGMDEGALGEGNASLSDDEELGSGGLYLYMEEKNLFLSATVGDDEPESDRSGGMGDDFVEGADLSGGGGFDGGSFADVQSTKTMKLLGPLRDFSIQYRRPGVTEVDDAGSDADWAESWDVEQEGGYPSAIEFIIFYEKPGVTEDLPTEELDGIRMVIPVYDTRNLVRGGRNVPF